MPDVSFSVVVAVLVAVVLVAVMCGVAAYYCGVERGRALQRVLSSRLGHGQRTAPSALLSTPEESAGLFERRDLSGVCSDCDAVPEQFRDDFGELVGLRSRS